MRKMTLRAYVDVLRFEDGIRGHKFFRSAAKRASELYLMLAAADARATAAESTRADPSEAAAGDAKRAKALAKREKAKARFDCSCPLGYPAETPEKKPEEEQGKKAEGGASHTSTLPVY